MLLSTQSNYIKNREPHCWGTFNVKNSVDRDWSCFTYCGQLVRPKDDGFLWCHCALDTERDRWVSWWPSSCSATLLQGAEKGAGPCQAQAVPTWGVGMGEAAGCVLAGCILGASNGTGTVRTISTPSVSGNAGGSCGGEGLDWIQVDWFSISTRWCSVRSCSSSLQRWHRQQRDTHRLLPPAPPLVSIQHWDKWRQFSSVNI